ncbi:MAG TPA: HAD family hydrolase [Ignavibacteria bacterium]|nr:HAD family hydrolase [Ignavibacteria bacterium]
MSNFKAVLFDVDGTLYNQTALRTKMSVKILLDFFASPFTAWRNINVIKYYRYAQEILREKKIYSAANGEGQIKLTSQLSGTDEKTVKEIISKWFEEIPLDVIPGCKRKDLEKTFEWLYKNGFKIGLYSDYDCIDKARVLKIDKYISVYVSSEDVSVGVFKPDPKGFLVASEKLGFFPDKILYVGDRAEVDLIGANAAGMKTALFGKLPDGDKYNFEIKDLSDIIKFLN